MYVYVCYETPALCCREENPTRKGHFKRLIKAQVLKAPHSSSRTSPEDIIVLLTRTSLHCYHTDRIKKV